MLNATSLKTSLMGDSTKAYIIIKELAFCTEVFSHTNPTVYAVLLNLRKHKSIGRGEYLSIFNLVLVKENIN